MWINLIEKVNLRKLLNKFNSKQRSFINKTPRSDKYIAEFLNDLILSLYKLYQKIELIGSHLIYETSIILIPTPDKENKRKQMIDQYPLLEWTYKSSTKY